MAKRKWSPGSRVNRQHLGTMLSRGDEDYIAFVAAIFAAKSEGDVEKLETLIEQGKKMEYLPFDALERVTGSATSAVEVARAAAANGARQLVFSLLQSGLDDAVQSLIDDESQPYVTEESVAEWRELLKAASS